MTPYSASRGIRYTAPPGPDGKRVDAEDEEAAEPSTAEVEADGGRADERGDCHAAADD
jgi:hypothetical protein